MVSLSITLKPLSPFSAFAKKHYPNSNNNALFTYHTPNSTHPLSSKRGGSVFRKKHTFVAVHAAPNQVKSVEVNTPKQLSVEEPPYQTESLDKTVGFSYKIPWSEVVVVREKAFWDRSWNSWDVNKLARVVAVHLMTLSAPFYFTWAALRVSLCLILINGICITFSYHRNLSHKSFELPKWLEYLFAYGGVMAFQGDPVEWVSNHRYHHKHCDKEGDPHSPTQGLWYSHWAWVFDTGSIFRKCGGYENVNDLLRQPFYRFMNRTFLLHQLAFATLLYYCGGMPYLVWGIGVATMVRLHTTFLVASVCHLWGTRPWNTSDLSRNNWWVAVLTFGEGWHNNHHAFEFSARHGLEWWQVDTTWYLIRFLEVIGLATNVKLPIEAQKQKMALL